MAAASDNPVPINNEVAAPAPAASSSSNPILTNLPHLVTVKLTQENYLLWRTQLLPYFRGQRLYGYLEAPSLNLLHFLTIMLPQTLP